MNILVQSISTIDDCDDELEPGEGEPVWEEEEVEGGIEIVEECPDDENSMYRIGIEFAWGEHSDSPATNSAPICVIWQPPIGWFT